MASYHSQEQTLAQLPIPSAEEMAHSGKLIEVIVDKIARGNGSVPFSEYMECLLYTPGLGYYSAGLNKFGKQGDFVTAPEISPLFGRTIANQCQQVFDQGCETRILEFGAGSGKLCEQILSKLDNPVDYLILEISADLRLRQQTYLKEKLTFESFDRITWLDKLPQNFNGVIIANEVLDAMPVSLVKKQQQQWFELGVAFDDDRFNWCHFAEHSDAVSAIQSIEKDHGLLPDGYVTEVNLNYQPWLKSLSEIGNQMVLLIIDYGYEQAQYYHPERKRGTLICHYRHRVHDDTLILPGLQDVTASVDFDAVADAAIASGFEVAGLVTQSQFLLANGLLDEVGFNSTSEDTLAQLDISQQIKTLTLPDEMGEKFKVVGLVKNLDLDLPAFSMRR
ncbi:MAG: SAM-dependent methyltransferase [Gammaproteobacteria bacterium]|nr:SAM-dependent methyltransferase [Gammaproteobacteria bacterium]